MWKIGRWKIVFGPVLWFEAKMPTEIHHFLWFWFLREARPGDIDKKQRFPIRTTMDHEGRRYYYYKAVRTQEEQGEEQEEEYGIQN